MLIIYLKSSSSSTSFSSGGVGGNGGDVLDSSNLESASGESSDGGLGSGTGALGFGSSSGSDLDVDGVDSDFLELLAHLLSSHHSGVGRGLFSIASDLHSSGDSAVGFSAGDIGYVDEGVVPGGHDMGDSDDWLVLLVDLWPVSFDDFFLMLFMDFGFHVLRFIKLKIYF